MPSRPGVLCIQGDFERHLRVLERLGVLGIEVRTPEDLSRADGLIIPGGESTTVGMLLDRHGLGEQIRARAGEGMPVWGTCMGMILMASEVEERPDQYTLGLLDATVRRNAYGAQINSFEDSVEVAGIGSSVMGVFIRAPVVVRMGPSVEAIAHYEGQIVAVRSKALLATSFHPELTEDTRFHEFFLSL